MTRARAYVECVEYALLVFPTVLASRAMVPTREMAVRAALGAGRLRFSSSVDYRERFARGPHKLLPNHAERLTHALSGTSIFCR